MSENVNDWLTRSRRPTLGEQLGSEQEKVYPARPKSFEDHLRGVFVLPAQSRESERIVRDEGDEALLQLAMRHAREGSSRRALEHHQAERRDRVEARPEQPKATLANRLQAWAETLSADQREEVPYTDWYDDLPPASQARVDEALAAADTTEIDVTPPTEAERDALEAELEEPNEPEWFYDGELYEDDVA